MPSLPALALKIVQGKYEPFPESLELGICSVIKAMLTLDATERPSVKNLLGYSFVIEICEKFEVNKKKDELSQSGPIMNNGSKSSSSTGG